MYTKILVATDLSPASHAVIRCVAGLRALGARECLLLQCVNVPHPLAPGVTQMQHALQQNLAEEKAVLEAGGFRVRAEVVPGFPQVEINRFAIERRCSLIVVGSRSQTLVREMLLGGVTYAVIHHAVKPVLVIPVKAGKDGVTVCAGGEHCDFTRHVFFATDFSDNAEQAFRAVRGIVAAGGRTVTLCHVQDKTRIDPHLMHRLEEFNAIDRQRLVRMKSVLTKAGARQVRIAIPFGHPEQEIMAEIEKAKATLAVLGSQGRGFFGEVCVGSVSHSVARRAQIPTLLIPMANKRNNGKKG